MPMVDGGKNVAIENGFSTLDTHLSTSLNLELFVANQIYCAKRESVQFGAVESERLISFDINSCML